MTLIVPSSAETSADDSVSSKTTSSSSSSAACCFTCMMCESSPLASATLIFALLALVFVFSATDIVKTPSPLPDSELKVTQAAEQEAVQSTFELILTSADDSSAGIERLSVSTLRYGSGLASPAA